MKTPRPSIEELIARQLEGTSLTDAERRELYTWLQASETNRRAYLRAYEAWGETHLAQTHFDTAQALQTVMARISETPEANRVIRRPLQAIRIALAAACVVLAVTGYYWMLPESASDIQTFIGQTETPVFTQKEVQLVLSKQKTLLLEEKKSIIRYDSAAIQINNAEKTIPKKEAAAFNQLVVPYGKQTTLTLADGTRVWINAGSRLVYPVVFEKYKREIYVEGEVYMEVAHDAARPFTVHTGKMDVCVLGTKFYISSYGKDHTHEVVLLSGSVSVSAAGQAEDAVRIVPGQQAVLDTSDKLAVSEVEAENYISWIHGYLPFNNERLENILERLSRYYNNRIECTPDAAMLTLSGKLDLKDDLSEVLKILSVTAPIRMQIIDPGTFRIDYQPTANPSN